MSVAGISIIMNLIPNIKTMFSYYKSLGSRYLYSGESLRLLTGKDFPSSNILWIIDINEDLPGQMK